VTGRGTQEINVSAPAPGGRRPVRRPAYVVVEIYTSPQLRKRDPGRSPSLLETLDAGLPKPQGSVARPQAEQSEETGATSSSSQLRGKARHAGASLDHVRAARGQEHPLGLDEPAHAVRSVECACTARPGIPCSPSGDHPARYLLAEQRAAISRSTLTRVIAGLDVIAQDVLIRPPGGATPAAVERAADG
jgi:hypothetical protein